MFGKEPNFTHVKSSLFACQAAACTVSLRVASLITSVSRHSQSLVCELRGGMCFVRLVIVSLVLFK